MANTIPYEKIQALLCMCPKLLELQEPKLEEQVRGRVLELLRLELYPSEPASPIPPRPEPEPEPHQAEEVEELHIKTIQGKRLAMSPKTNGCFEVLEGDEVGAWIGMYNLSTGTIDRTEPDPDLPLEQRWMNLPPIGKHDPLEQDIYRQILLDKERICIANPPPKKDGSSTVLLMNDNISAINREGVPVGFLFGGRLYQSPTALLRAAEEKKTSRTGNLHVCVQRKDDRDGLNKWFCLKVLSAKIRGF